MAPAVMNLLDFAFASSLYSLPDGATFLEPGSTPSLLQSGQKRGQTCYVSAVLLSPAALMQTDCVCFDRKTMDMIAYLLTLSALWTCHFRQAGQVLLDQESFD